ncbi:MAG: hypothetical protein ACJ77K_14085 [Bacteroidia bacterium]|jgi:hypothetical protein
MKKILFIAFSIISISASAQLMSLGFIKNSMSYNRTAFENELFKKHFFKVENSVENPQNALLKGASSYSNEQNTANGEIKVLSLITDKQKIMEVYFINGPKNDWSKNFTEVYNQMVSFFNNQTSFKTKKFDNKETEVTKFSKDNSYYYVYKLKDNMVIVVSDKKLEDTYFK